MEGNNKEEVLEEKKQNSNQKNLNKLRTIMENAKLSPAVNSIINNSDNFRNNCFRNSCICINYINKIGLISEVKKYFLPHFYL